MARGPGERTSNKSAHAIDVDLIAVLVAVTDGEPRVLTVENGAALPSGPFEHEHRSLQTGLRIWVERQTRQPLGFLEQLYTFADRDRGEGAASRTISISYLGLTREQTEEAKRESGWRNWYEFFPWEDRRRDVSALDEAFARRLRDWARSAPDRGESARRKKRIAASFGLDGRLWNEELVLQRYELLYEAALIPEAARDNGVKKAAEAPEFGRPMAGDHRRILATAIARLRAKIKYRPVVFELMPASFTFLQLQRSVEALAGREVHKPNFRRLIEQQELVEETGETSTETPGRPARFYRFREAVLAERASAGTRLPLIRA